MNAFWVSEFCTERAIYFLRPLSPRRQASRVAFFWETCHAARCKKNENFNFVLEHHDSFQLCPRWRGRSRGMERGFVVTLSMCQASIGSVQ